MEKYFQEGIVNMAAQIIMAPVYDASLIPTLLPIILGGLVIELYFGKHENEELGWNSSVSNSVIWVSTGLTLLLTAELATGLERAVTYFLIGVGLLTGYMNFFHKWSSSVAFLASSSGMVYSLAYVSVVMIKSSIPVNSITVQASVLSLTGIAIFFQVVKILEPPARDDFGFPEAKR